MEMVRESGERPFSRIGSMMWERIGSQAWNPRGPREGITVMSDFEMMLGEFVFLSEIPYMLIGEAHREMEQTGYKRAFHQCRELTVKG